ncbi:ABC transporter substrate-binding protein [Tomitella biformata]|uniref:ABC transporter substrate-binding protein n=1 Tax=Tomitella biformata TaxID=630403 RepID=UPI000464169B|nr:ABC transporter substrate-binding protein [Tomitella biformata]
MRSYIPRMVAAVSAVSLLTLAACSSSVDADTAATENTSARGPITFAMGSNDAGSVKPIIESWNASHPDEQVSLKELAKSADDARDQLVQSLQAGNDDYDVMALDVVWTAEFAARGWLQELSGDFAMDTSGLLPATVESATFNGKQYAAPQNTNAQLLYYRTDLVPQAPTDWQGLLDSCTIAVENNVDCLVTQLKQFEGLTVNATQFINSWGGSVVGPDGKTATVDSEQAKAGLQALVDAYQNEDIAKRSTGFEESETNLAFTGGESMYAYNWPYMVTTSEDAEASKVVGKVGVAPILSPTGPGASTLGGYNNGINVNSKNKATAKDFMAFVQNEESQKSFADNSFPPVLASVYDDATLIADHPYLPVLKTALENAKPRPVSPNYTAVSKAIQDNVYAALNGNKTVDQAVADMTTAINNAGK